MCARYRYVRIHSYWTSSKGPYQAMVKAKAHLQRQDDRVDRWSAAWPLRQPASVRTPKVHQSRSAMALAIAAYYIAARVYAERKRSTGNGRHWRLFCLSFDRPRLDPIQALRDLPSQNALIGIRPDTGDVRCGQPTVDWLWTQERRKGPSCPL